MNPPHPTAAENKASLGGVIDTAAAAVAAARSPPVYRPKPVEAGTRKPGSPREEKHAEGGAGLAATAPAADTENAAEAAATAAAGSSLEGMEGTEDTGAGASATAAAAAAAAVDAAASGPTKRRFEMHLVPPQDAPVIMIQRLVRGRLMRETYKGIKVCAKDEKLLSAATMLWYGGLEA